MRLTTLIFLSIIVNTSALSQTDTIKYIFIGHCYQSGTDGSEVDYRLLDVDFSPYQGIWLGGDICSEMSLKHSTLESLYKLFNLDNPLTFMALGNHDTRGGNWEWIREFTKRETFFANYYQGVTEIVLNTNILPNNCFLLNEQYQMIKNVCDTIQNSSHLILLMHHGIWNNIPGLPSPGTYAHSSLQYWNSNCYDVNSNFVNSIYPKLLEVEKRGIEVICVMGDMGTGEKKIHFISDDGIDFLGCGLYHNSPDDYVLIFNHIPKNRELFWEFKLLESLK